MYKTLCHCETKQKSVAVDWTKDALVIVLLLASAILKIYTLYKDILYKDFIHCTKDSVHTSVKTKMNNHGDLFLNTHSIYIYNSVIIFFFFKYSRYSSPASSLQAEKY